MPDQRSFIIDVRTVVGAVDRLARYVEMTDGQRVDHDALFLATGSTPRPSDGPAVVLDDLAPTAVRP